MGSSWLHRLRNWRLQLLVDCAIPLDRPSEHLVLSETHKHRISILELLLGGRL